MDFSSLIKIFDKIKVGDNLHLLKSLLYILLNISNDHHRTPTLISKIEEIIKYFKDQIINYFPNWEIFNIFKSNKRILLFLFEEKMIKMENYIAVQIITEKYTKRNYFNYFLPEIKPFVNERFLKNHGREELIDKISEDLPENFYEKRKSGENDNTICEMIRNDSVTEFSSFVEKNKISLDEKIKESIYETNLFLLKRKSKSSMIEYAAFFGSDKIFKYLQTNGVKLTSSLWLYAIHGQNTEIIRTLNENKVEPVDKSRRECFYESIKCHDNDMANYFIFTFLNEEDESASETVKQCLKYYNFAFTKNQFIDESSFIELCQYDYYLFVDSLFQKRDIDINKIKIYGPFVLYNFKLKHF